MAQVNLLELDALLADQNPGAFVSLDTDSVRKIRKGEYMRKVSTGIVAQNATSYHKRIRKQNPDYVFTPKDYMESFGISGNMQRHKDKGTLYLSIPFDTKAKTRKPDVIYYLGESESGPWREVTYQEAQDALPPSARDDYRKGKREEKGVSIAFRTIKAETITGFRGGKRVIEAS